MGTSLKSLGDVKSFLKNVVKESINKTFEDAAIDERELQQTNAQPEKEQVEQKEEKKDEKLQPGHVTIEDIITELNTIRSGKSLKNPDIMSKMNDYYENLDENERVTLYAFLKGISQVLIGMEADAATDNDDIDPGMKIEPTSEPQQKQTKTVVTKKPVATFSSETKKQKPQQSLQQTGVEDTTPPKSLPIKPKRRA